MPFPLLRPVLLARELQPGVQRLNGVQALAMARDRHSMLAGDFARSENQGRLMLASLTQFRKEYQADLG